MSEQCPLCGCSLCRDLDFAEDSDECDGCGLPELEWPRVREIIAERDRLAVIVGMLPTTADGVCLLEAKDPHWLCDDGTVSRVSGWYIYDDGVWGVRTAPDAEWCSASFCVLPNDNRCFSTREAAGAAKANGAV